MTQIFVVTASSPEAQEHLASSVANSLEVKRLLDRASGSQRAEISAVAEQHHGLFAWGAAPGPKNIGRWQRMKPDDWVLFVARNTYRFVARVVRKYDSVPLATAIWGVDEENQTWNLMYFLSRPKPVSVSVGKLQRYLPSRYGGFTRIHEYLLQAIEKDFGTVDAFIEKTFGVNESGAQQDNHIVSEGDDVWIFQANPEMFDARSAVRELSEMRWLANQHADELEAGATAYVWESGASGGVVAHAELVEPTQLLPVDPQSLPFSKDPTEFEGEKPRVVIKILKTFEPAISRKIVLQREDLRDLRIIRQPFYGTNFPVSEQEAISLAEVAQNYLDQKLPFTVHGVTLSLSSRDVINAFNRTTPSQWEERPGRQPYWMVNLGKDKKPVKAVFRNISGVPPDLDFNSIEARSVFQALGFALTDARESQELLPEPVNDADLAQDLFIEKDDFLRICEVFKRKKNLLLQGPPGVGKTFFARRLAAAIVERHDPRFITRIQFHQSYSYEDFVQGLRPTDDGKFAVRDGPFVQFCNVARENPGQRYVFVIDEINRGNLSKILGEGMLLIEADKRSEEWAIGLTYSTKDSPKFFVPENIHVLGMMNTADRSLAMVDYALRRRFAFVDLKPAFEHPKFREFLEGRGANAELVRRIISKVGKLNETIRGDRDLGPGFMIGHSYFCPTDEDTVLDDSWYRAIVDNEIAPLLREYWSDKPERFQDDLVQKLFD